MILRKEHQDLKDVGLSAVLEKCVYLLASRADCDAADTASSSIEQALQLDIRTLLEIVLPAMQDNGIVVYTLYAPFLDDKATACNDQSWVLFHPNRRSRHNCGLSLTTQRRQRMNEMVRAANARIQVAIADARTDVETRQITIVLAGWDAYIEKVKDRYFEDGLSIDPDADNELASQKYNYISKFVPREMFIQPELGKSPNNRPSIHTSRDLSRDLLPDDITRRSHPNPLAHSIIAQIALDQITTARAEKFLNGGSAHSCDSYSKPPACGEDDKTMKWHLIFDRAVDDFCKTKSDSTVTQLELDKILHLSFSAIEGSTCGPSDCTQSMNKLYGQFFDDYGAYQGIIRQDNAGGEGIFSSGCGIYSFKVTNTTPAFSPGPSAVDSDGATIKPWCSSYESQYIPPADLDAAIAEYCDNDGKPFFKGHIQIGHKIGSGPDAHLYTDGMDISHKVDK
ncbi:MAG: hypothetical protein Q9210_006938 [Variospora velana]